MLVCNELDGSQFKPARVLEKAPIFLAQYVAVAPHVGAWIEILEERHFVIVRFVEFSFFLAGI